MSRLDSLTRVYDHAGFHGVIMIAQGNTLVYQNAFGYADLDSKTRMTIDVLFKTESVGKLFTASRIMQLLEDRKIDLKGTIASYLPDWKVKNADKIPFTTCSITRLD